MCRFQHSENWGKDTLIVLVESVSQGLSFVFGEFLTHKYFSVDEWLHFYKLK